jgi:hypothetical protein
MSLRLCSVSVDLDPLSCYFQIHSLGQPSGALADVVLRRALPRFLDLFARHDVLATLFVVGSDIEKPAAPDAKDAAPPQTAALRTLLLQAAGAGHELGNHSLNHLYDLSRRSRPEIEREIGGCHQALRELLGRSPIGFRAPGYELSAEVVDVLEAFGYRYDSSLFPSPAYYLAKLAVLGKMALFGKSSASIVGSPLHRLAPTQPYRPDSNRPWRSGSAGIVELPIAVTPWLRLPAIGTSLLLSKPMRSLLLRGMTDQPFFNLELHGMDLLDADKDGLPEALRERQIDLRVPLKERLNALEELLYALKKRYLFVPLCTVAEGLQRHGHLHLG